MPKIFNVYIIFILISFSLQRNDYTLQEINEKFKMFVNSHKSKGPIGFNLSETLYLELLNITITYVPQITTYDMFFNQIDYYNMDVFFVFNMKLNNGYIKGNPFVKNITFQVDNLSTVIHYDRFQFYKLTDNGFQFNKDFTPVSYNISMKYINEYDLYKDLFDDENNREKIKDNLLSRWNELLYHMLSIFPQCDAFYYYNKMIEYLKRKGLFDVHHPKYPDFKQIDFQSIAYTEIYKINNYTEQLIGVKVRVYYNINGSIYNPLVYFDKIHVTKNEIIIGNLSPINPVLEEVIKYCMKDAFEFVIKK